MTPPLLTADDVAAMLGVSTDWVYAETRRGAIPHVKLGRYRRYRRESIEDWIASLESAKVAAPNKAPPHRVNGRGLAQEHHLHEHDER